MNKTLIALSAAAIIGSFSAAFAYEDPENKIGDRYPLLEQTYAPTKSAWVGGTTMPRQVVQYGNQAPENMIGDRYQGLATVYQPIASIKFASRKVVQHMTYGSTEAPENKLGDRFPFLEQAYSTKSVPTGRVMVVRTHKQNKV